MSSNVALAVTGSSRTGLEVYRGSPARAYPALAWDQAPPAAKAAWKRFLGKNGGRWQALWDLDTGVPQRILGSGIAAPGSMSSADAAERYARALLAEHIDLLAPGSRAEDFVVVSNHLGDGMRTIGMYQLHRGMRVIGAQVSVRFKADRLFVIGSEALPAIALASPAPSQPLDSAALRARALAWVRTGAATAQASTVDGPLVLPVVRSGALGYHEVVRVRVDAHKPIGRYDVYLDASTGEPIAREQLLRFADGLVRYDVPARYPEGGRTSVAARTTALTVAGTAAVTDDSGVVSWLGDAPVSVDTFARGPLVRVDNLEEGGENATATFTLMPGGELVWNQSTIEAVDAQLTTFIHARLVKDYSRTFAPELAFLNEELSARVNIDDSCNAFSDGLTINFFRAGNGCANTGRLADVIYHEFGHSLHQQSIIPGVGSFDPSFSEGLADFLAAAITRDPGMGRGFFFNDEPLRHIDPPGFEHRWPDDIGEVHYTGLIFAGAMWDLRSELIAIHGAVEGEKITNRLFYAAVQRATSIPSTYVEVLAADDDDGNLDNGTPHECAINHSFGDRHGLRPLDHDFVPLGVQPIASSGYEVSLRITGTSARCPGDAIDTVTLRWGLRGTGANTGDGTPNEIVLDELDGVYSGMIPQQADGSVVRYQMGVTLAGGGQWTFPSNLADPAYELYVGELLELYCTDFESDPFAEGWTHAATRNPAGDRWEWGAPMGTANGNDPPGAFSGTRIMGSALDAGGDYPNETTSHAESPSIDVGSYSDVRLQYRRWLTVEDALYDYAIISANGTEVWRNYMTNSGNIHHLDGQWVFHDVPLSEHISDGTVRVTFSLESDPGLEFGGWAIDDLCVVARPDSICGDGQLSGAEQCDSGEANSSEVADSCRGNCRLPVCGDGVTDSDEDCDDGNADDMDGCTAACVLTALPADGCGCRTGGRTGGTPLMLLLAGLAIVLMRRRRHA